MSTDRPMTTRELAERLSVDPSTVRHWVAEGKITPIVTPGGHYRFPEEIVEQILNKPKAADRPPPQ